MVIGVLKERNPENRVAVVPDTAKALIAMKAQVMVESGAGMNAFISDMDFEIAGAKCETRLEVLKNAGIILTVDALSIDETSDMQHGTIVIGSLNPQKNPALITQFLKQKITSFSLEFLPRTTLAQSMDINSSMATVSGYKAVLDAAGYLPKFFPMFMTAAGTIRPAKVLVLGAGVAGLQALATARRLGAVVEVFDVRNAVKEEVQSLGGKFIEVEGAREDVSAGGYAVEQSEDYLLKQAELIHSHASRADVIITTAQLPGRKAPLLLHKKTVESLSPGAVIVDLAASSGGNCELTVAGQITHHAGITIIGKTNYPSLMPFDASRMYSNNLVNFTRLIINSEGRVGLNMDDVILRNTCITHEGKVVNEKITRA
jgi:NAD(P) transhydrogenase subunit alpha